MSGSGGRETSLCILNPTAVRNHTQRMPMSLMQWLRLPQTSKDVQWLAAQGSVLYPYGTLEITIGRVAKAMETGNQSRQQMQRQSLRPAMVRSDNRHPQGVSLLADRFRDLSSGTSLDCNYCGTGSI